MAMRLSSPTKSGSNNDGNVGSSDAPGDDGMTVPMTSSSSSSSSSSRSTFACKAVIAIIVMGFLLLIFDSHDAAENSSLQLRLNGNMIMKKKSTPTVEDALDPDEIDDKGDDEDDSSSSSSSSSTTKTKTYSYKVRGQPISDEQRKAMIDKWGSWTLVDPKRSKRPKNDFYLQYKNRDVPRSEFPSTAWQTDIDYLDQFLPEALKLVERAQEAILAEYGKDHKEEATFEERSDMFHLEIMDTWEDLNYNSKRPPEYMNKGGLTNKKSWEGFVRTVLHAVMTEDSFVFAMGGHSAAAGHGNTFVQSYTLQIQWILEAVFSRLGVKHEARNFGMGGLGTAQAGIASSYLYGTDVDILMWDSGMTEGDSASQDLFHRQYILSAQKIPILWSQSSYATTVLHAGTGVYAGIPGWGMAGIPQAKTVEDIDAMPWAVKYLSCDGEILGVCNEHRYNASCWVPREDVTMDWDVNPETGGRASWHPGNRVHQLQGRILAFTILSALRDGLTLWKNADGYALPDEAWHLTEHYDSVRSKVVDAPGDCFRDYDAKGLGWACKYPVQARTQFTPRAYPSLTSIKTLLHDEQSESMILPDNFYEPPDTYIPFLHPPDGEIDVLNIVEQGVEFEPVNFPDYTDIYKKPNFDDEPKVPLGKGVGIHGHPGDPRCDGSVNSWCNRGRGERCPLAGHNDGRSGLTIDGFSGWLVMNLPALKYGYIAVKYHSWYDANSLGLTDGWTSINNEEGTRHLFSYDEQNHVHFSSIDEDGNSPRNLEIKDFCPDFHFEYAIDGTMYSLTLDEWKERNKQVQRVVEIITLLADPDYTGGEPKQVELAIRITGCGRDKSFGLTHVYWS